MCFGSLLFVVIWVECLLFVVVCVVDLITFGMNFQMSFEMVFAFRFSTNFANDCFVFLSFASLSYGCIFCQK